MIYFPFSLCREIRSSSWPDATIPEHGIPQCHYHVNTLSALHPICLQCPRTPMNPNPPPKSNTYLGGRTSVCIHALFSAQLHEHIEAGSSHILNFKLAFHPNTALNQSDESGSLSAIFKGTACRTMTCDVSQNPLTYISCIALPPIRKHPSTTVDFLAQEYKTRSDPSEFMSVSTEVSKAKVGLYQYNASSGPFGYLHVSLQCDTPVIPLIMFCLYNPKVISD